MHAPANTGTTVLCPLLLAVAARADLPVCRVELLGPSLSGFAMNQRGAVAGRRLDAQQVGHAFVVPAGSTEPQDLPVPAEWRSSDAYALSDSGIVEGAVSAATIASVVSRPAAWFPTSSGWEFVLLPALPGDVHGAAFGVNDHGDIVGGSGGLGLGAYPRAARFTPASATELPGIGTPADVNNARLVVAGNQLLDLATMSVSTIPLPPGNWQGMVAGDALGGLERVVSAARTLSTAGDRAGRTNSNRPGGSRPWITLDCGQGSRRGRRPNAPARPRRATAPGAGAGLKSYSITNE